MSENILTHVISSTRARLVLGAAVLVGIRFERPPAEQSSARAERLSRSVDLLTVLNERLFLADNVLLSPMVLEFYGWPPTCSPLASCNLFLLSSASQPPAGNWPVPWTVWVDPTFAALSRASKAFMSFLAGASLWTPPLSSS